MKFAVRLLTFSLWMSFFSGFVFGSGAKNPHLRSSGVEYVRLGDWARANEFVLRWIERDKTLQLSNRLARMIFTVDSHDDRRNVEINGVDLLLAFPLLYRNGVAYISQLDLELTLGPILTPPRNSSGLKVRTVCIDPGHGGKDPGFHVGSHEEQKYTLLLAQEVRDQLKHAGLNVVLTRTKDTYVDLPARASIARKRKADLFVSLHFNSSVVARNTVKGVEVYCCTPAGATSSNAGGEGTTKWVVGNRNDEKNTLLAYQVQKALVKGLAVGDRGVKHARFQVLREATMPAILIEGGFMSHPAEGKRIFDASYRRQMARAIVNGILAYNRIVGR